MAINNKPGISDDVYWATLPPRDLVNECKAKCQDYMAFLEMSGRLERWQRNYSNYYGQASATPATSSKLATAGENGEYTTMMVNDYRSLLTKLVVMVTQGRPYLKAKAGNTDVQSYTDTIIANSLLEYALRSEHAETDLKRAVELALLYDECFLLQLWDANIGDDVALDPDTNQVVHAGDITQYLIGPSDCCRDVNLRNDKAYWYIVRIQKNRYDLIAQFPAFKDQILAADTHENYLPGIYTFAVPNPSSNHDLVDCFLFLHKKTPALSQGRLTMYVGEEALIDGPLPYDDIPMGRIAPSDQDQTCFGYSQGNDLVALQEGKDALYSLILSNEVTFGGQNIAGKKGCGMSWQQLGQGFNYVELENPQTDLNPLQLTKTAPEIFEFIKTLDGKQTQLSGLNDTVRGNPEANVQSGAAMALIEAQAIQFVSGLQESYVQLEETWANHRISIYQRYADEPRVIDIAGKSNASYMKSFKWTKNDIKSVKRVQAEVVSALSNTYAGKLSMADNLLNKGLIKRPDEYFTVIETGRLEPLYHDELTDLVMIASENEALQEGRPVLAMVTDLHKQHVLAHRSLLNDPNTRIMDKNLRDAVNAHILEHTNIVRQMDPVTLWITGNDMPPEPGPQGGQPAPPPQGLPPHAPIIHGTKKIGHPGMPNSGSAGVMNPEPPVEQQAQGVNQPKMPINPLTKQRATPQSGPTSGT